MMAAPNGAVVPAAPFVPVTPARRRFVQRVACDGRRLGFAVQFDPAGNQFMRELGCAWAASRRMWVVEVHEAKSVVSALQGIDAVLPAFHAPGLRDEALAAWRSPAPAYFCEVLDLQLLPLSGGGFAVTAEFDPLVARVLRALGGRFHKPAAAWEVHQPRDVILAALERDAGVLGHLVFLHDTIVELEQLGSSTGNELPISVAGAAPGPSDERAPDAASQGGSFLSAFGSPLATIPVDEEALRRAEASCGLRDYQVPGVRHLLGRSGALLADDMGLGKSRQAVVASRMAAGALPVLIVCPASLGINWCREIAAVYPDEATAMVGEDSPERLRQARWIVANYERLGGLVRDKSLRLGVMTIDEAHYLKEHQAGRTRNAFLLAERVPRVFLLSGTPVLNREVELHTLLRLSGHPIGRMPLVDFRAAYAGSAERREWMLRRGKDVLKDLGAKTEQVRVVSAPDGLAGYRAIAADTSLQSMAKITRLRQHLEALKLEFIIESVECLPQNAKAIVFCEYIESVQTLKHALAAAGIGCVSLVGSDSTKARMKAIDAFQQDASVRVFIGTTQAAGVGITLTAANYVFFASLPWTPALKRQAEDRAYRSGQTRDVFVIVPVVADTIDEQIVNLLGAKREIEVSVIEVNRTRVAA